MKALLGMCAGCVGAFIGTPAEVALIRMTADGRLPELERRNYKNVFDALFRIFREEGKNKIYKHIKRLLISQITYNQNLKFRIKEINY